MDRKIPPIIQASELLTFDKSENLIIVDVSNGKTQNQIMKQNI